MELAKLEVDVDEAEDVLLWRQDQCSPVVATSAMPRTYEVDDVVVVEDEVVDNDEGKGVEMREAEVNRA